MLWFPILITSLACYLLGNLNGAALVSFMMHDDVRSHGSGNAGLTNFIRNYGASRSAMVIAIDVCKATIGCLIAGLVLAPHGYELEGRILGGVWVMIGHDFPALLGFKGGKGILSGWFIAWVCDWRIGLMIGVVFFICYLLTRYVSLGSLLAAVTFGVGFILFHHNNLPVLLGGLFMSALTIFMHRSNLLRLIRGEERKTDLFGKGSKQ